MKSEQQNVLCETYQDGVLVGSKTQLHIIHEKEDGTLWLNWDGVEKQVTRRDDGTLYCRFNWYKLQELR